MMTSKKDKVSVCLECVSLYFEANVEANVVAKDKRVAVLLTVIGGEKYALLNSLLSSAKPHDKAFNEIFAVLERHFEPRPVIIAELFHFHRCQQGRMKPLQSM